MDLTQGTDKEKYDRSKKMMLWFGIGSLIMSFAGLISAFIVSSKQRIDKDWLVNYELPKAFFVGLVIILTSSITLIIAKRALKQNKDSITSLALLVTFVLGIIFIYCQFIGFKEIINSGYHFTGPTSNITITYIYLIAMLHIGHVIAGLIALLVVIINHFRNKYNAENLLGFELASSFWHFVDVLWLVLFLFLYFFRYII